METQEKKLKVFRENYDRLKNGFNCCKEVVAALLYAKGLISAEVRDSKDTNTMLAALERVLAVKEDAWDILVKEIMVDPPLAYLAPKLTKDLEEKLAKDRRLSQESAINDMYRGGGISSFLSESVSGTAAHPTSLSFNTETESEYPPIDSGTGTSDKSLFPSNYFNLMDPSIPNTIIEDDSKTTPDSGIIMVNETPNRTKELITDSTSVVPPMLEDDPVLVSEVVQSIDGTTRSEMVNPVGDTNRKATPSATPRSLDNKTKTNTNTTVHELKNDNTILKRKLHKLKEECDGLRMELDTVNDKRDEESKLLERKLKQLSDDNELLGKQCAERRQLESENRRMVQEVKRLKNVMEEYEIDNEKLKICLKIAERNACVQSVTIDKLRAKVTEQEVALTEYKETQLEDMAFKSSHNNDPSPSFY